jgi:CRISPR-associated exonuclease Cas4
LQARESEELQEKEVFEELLDESLRFTGTQVNYYFVCKRKLWLFSHNIELESDSDLVHLGRLLHEHSYKRKFKEVQVDRIKVDFLEQSSLKQETAWAPPSEEEEEKEEGLDNLRITHKATQISSIILHEVKRSKSMQDAHVFQLLYYIYYLKKNFNANISKGILHYPLLKTNVPVEITRDKGIQVENVILDIKRIISMANPPEPVWLNYCKSCAYREMCWG